MTAAEPAELERFIEANGHRVAYDVVDAPAVLYTHASELRAAQEIWPKIQFHAMREHGGLVVHSEQDRRLRRRLSVPRPGAPSPRGRGLRAAP